jgi:DNA-binding MarR family transcriptional regulator
MAVKSPSSRSPASTDDVREVLRLLGTIIRGLKRGGPDPPAALSDAFESGHLGPRHIPVLMTLILDGPLGVSDLAHRIGLSVATTSLMVGELDRVGLVEWAEDDSDRRRTIVRLPEEHRTVIDAWAQGRFAPVRRALGRMSGKERAHFIEGLRVVAEESGGSGRRSSER